MTITSSNIRLLESERMADTPDGGGRRTNNLVPDGVAGNVFPKVSRVDSVYGRVNLRKLYAHVNTVSVETLAGAHAIITQAPSNPKIGVVLFATGSDYDTRDDARDRIESYVIAGPESRMVVYGRQLKGASAVLVYQRIEDPLPEVGDVYCLSEEIGNVVGVQQFVRVQDVAHEVRTFTDQGADFQRRVVTLKIGAQLRVEFRGLASPATNSSARGNTLMRATTVADASRYYGIQPLAEAAAKDALELKVASVFAPLVPTAQRESALTLASTGGAIQGVNSGTVVINEGQMLMPGGANVGTVTTIRTTAAMQPGSVRVSEWSLARYSSHDDGLGNLIPDGVNGGWTGTVDYLNKTISAVQNFGGQLFITADYLPQAEVSQAGHTKEISITLATRGTVYSIVLEVLPARGTVTVQYRSLGRWYTLRDRGDGELVGDDPAYGTGLADYVTGAVTVTLGALPDVGSSVIVLWGSPIHYEMRLNDTGGKAYQDITLAHAPVSPGELQLTYTANGVDYEVTTDVAGNFSGSGASGRFDWVTAKGRVEYSTKVPDFDSSVRAAYKSWVLDPAQGIVGTPVVTKPLPVPTVIGEAVLVSTVTGLLGLSLTVSIGGVATETAVSMIPFRAEASGALVATSEVMLRNDTARVTVPVGTVLGALNATLGTILYNPTMTLPTAWYIGGDHPNWQQGAYLSQANVAGASVSYTPATYTTEGGDTIPADTAARIYTNRTEDLAVDDTPVRIDLTRTSTAQVVAGSVVFDFAGKRFLERSGTLYVDKGILGDATAAGTIDYATGIATPTLWTRGAPVALSVLSALIKLGDWTSSAAYFRTAGSPLRPASTVVQVTAVDGALLTATSDASGNIESAYIHGRVEQSMGVVALRFGQWLPVAGNEGEPWYDPINVVGSQVLKPRPIQPQTLRYSTVVVASLPLSADILGLDPTRLPTDGRAPIYRPADVAVIHHTDDLDVGTPTAGQVIDVGRTVLDTAWLEDANRKKLAASMYVADLDNGLITMDAGLSLAGYVAPITVQHRIGEMLLLTDVQINGQVGISAPLSRAYPMGSQLSSALLFGDLFARVESLFDQKTWGGVWSDTLIGDQADTEYDETNFPVEVLNESAVNERWRISFTNNAGNVQVIGENLGVIFVGNISADIAPVNLLTGKHYFVLRKEGWGVTPWAVGTQLRFNTVAAAPSFWIGRSILSGASLAGDSFDAQIRGDAD